MSLHLKILMGFFFCFFAIVHSFFITEIPAGLYLDETSIGLNAATLIEDGTGEHGVLFPIYFEAFGEWKNPLYIYASAVSFSVFGVSEWSLRITSVAFFMIFLWGVFVFSRQISQKPSVSFYSVVIAGTLPWFFTLSRISFEVISQIAMAVWFLVFAYKAYSACHQDNSSSWISSQNISALIAGLFLALFLYSYSTSRVLAFGILLALIISFSQKKYWKIHSVLFASFAICIIPYILFSFSHPGALSARFELLTYIYNDGLSMMQKTSMFLHHYFSAFDISSFLLFEGDANPRHSSGFMGQVFFIPFLLFLVGVSSFLQKMFSKEANLFSRKWAAFLFLLFLGSALPAAITNDIHHSLRLLLFGFCMFLFSVYGYKTCRDFFKNSVLQKTLFCAIVFVGIGSQSLFYFHDYFTDYPKKTIGAFGGYELQNAMEWANLQSEESSYFYENSNSPLYASIGFYNKVLKSNIVLEKKLPQKGDCVLWYSWNAPLNHFSPISIFEGDSIDGIVKGACY